MNKALPESQKPFYRVRLIAVYILVAILVVNQGCSSSDQMTTAPVKGKVMYKGKPVPSGTVMFMPSNGPAAQGELSADGMYELSTYTTGGGDGAVLGTHQVSIVALEDNKGGLPEQRSGTPKPLVPEKYLSHTKSGLKVEVKSGSNEHNFDLQ